MEKAKKEKFSTARLQRLFAPKSIVVIGGTWGTRVIEECKNSGYAGKIYAIHDQRDEMAGVKCYRSVADLPEPPDACYIAIKHEKTIEIIKQLNDIGAGGAVVFAAGFAEIGPEGVLRQQRLIAACQNEKLGAMPFVGPNCYGIINMNLGSVMWPDFQGLTRLADNQRGAALITQSGNIGINLTMQRRGLPISYMMTMGNQAMVTIPDVMRVMADDKNVSAIGLHIEGFGDVQDFIDAVRYCHERGKSVAVLKTGLSNLGAALTMSHTASLAGGGGAAAAFLQKIGVPQLFDVPEFLEMLKLQMAFGLKKLPRHKTTHHGNHHGKNDIRVISFSCSGGEATLIADIADTLNRTAATHDIAFPPMPDKVKKNLDELHAGQVALNNPFDYQTYIWGNKEGLKKNFAMALETDVDYGILILDTPNRAGMDAWGWRDTQDGFVAGVAAHNRRGIVLASLVECLPAENACHELLAQGIAPLAGIETCLKLLPLLELTPDYYQPIGLANGLASDGTGDKKEKMLDTPSARALLGGFGLNFPKSQMVDAKNFAAVVKDFKKPLVLKAEGIAHKTEAGAVRLNLTDDAAIAKSAQELFAIADNITIEEMMVDKKLELILGVNNDAVVGMALIIGEGGILTELRADRILIPLPTSAGEIETALQRLKIYPLMAGFRGQKPLAIKSVVAAAMAINNFAVKHQHELVTLDINPLLLSENGAVAVDQLVVLKG
ncbi:MAG: acetate--CoA ligase family protein [Hydrotalea sp.]|nr:acetate--CoA ligase family protein [Hydrotalea sp.]